MGSSSSSASHSGQGHTGQRRLHQQHPNPSHPEYYLATTNYPPPATTMGHPLPPYPIVQQFPNVPPIFVQQQPYNQLPPPVQRLYSWSEARDKAFSRILSAEEFLARIQEHDTMIQAASRMPDRQNYVPAIAKMLALRGHLHGELVRIQMMLAEDDPQMKSIAEFEVSNAEVVQRLRELKDQSDRLTRDASSSTDLLDMDKTASGSILLQTNGGVACHTQTSTYGERNVAISTSTQADKVERADIGIQRQQSFSCGTDGDYPNEDGTTTVDISTMTEEDLKKKHSQEESQVADKFAHVIASNELSMDQVNRVLSEHAASVQLLKMRQADERKKLRAKLDEKRRKLRAAAPGIGGGSGKGSSSDENDEFEEDGEMREEGGEWRTSTSRPTSEDELGTSLTAPPTPGTTDLSEAVRRLEVMRLHGQLTADAVASMMGQYLPQSQSSAPGDRRRRLSPTDVNNAEMKESASQLVLDNITNQKQIQTKREHEKQLMEAKLRQRLKEKNYQQQRQRAEPE